VKDKITILILVVTMYGVGVLTEYSITRKNIDNESKVYELDFGNGRVHFVGTYRGAAYLMLRMEPGAVSVYDLPKGEKPKRNGK